MNTLELCEKYLKNYTINPDNTVDVNGHVAIIGAYNINGKLPINFNKIFGMFWCKDNALTTLENSPRYVENCFFCRNNKLTTLEGSPKYVGETYDCRNNKLTTLKGIEKCEIIGDFNCYGNNNIPPENYIYILTAKIGGYIHIGDADIENILNTYKNEVKYLHKALSELRKLSYFL
jgi:hypothetical protein